MRKASVKVRFIPGECKKRATLASRTAKRCRLKLCSFGGFHRI